MTASAPLNKSNWKGYTMFKYAIAAALLFAATPANARETVTDDGNELLDICSKEGYFSQGYCLGYIRALSSGVDMLLYTNKQRICYGPNITIGQVRDVVLAYLRRNPAKRNENAMVLVSWASAEAWPCKP